MADKSEDRTPGHAMFGLTDTETRRSAPAEAPPEASAAPEQTPVATTSAAPAARSGGDESKAASSKRRGNRVQKVGTVASDKMQQTVVVRVDRLVLHPKYRRYVRRTSKFMAHDELGATTGDRVRIVETRPVVAPSSSCAINFEVRRT